MLEVLGRRNFALLWLNGLISTVSSTGLFVVLMYYTYDLTGSALASGALLAVYPAGAAAPFARAGDDHDRPLPDRPGERAASRSCWG